ncbi:UxaA family hydrolase [Tessaracoccus terricola]
MPDQSVAAPEELTWLGYQRPDGSLGIRNRVLVVYTVECAHFVADEIVRACADNDVEVVGFAGCTDNEYAIRLLGALLRHPNVGAALLVGLGCEYLQPDKLAALADETGRPTTWFRIQDHGGTTSSIEHGVAAVRELQQAIAATPRVPMGLTDLVVGAECGGSDFTSGLAGNAVVGSFFDVLVDAGGTAIFEEIVEAIGLRAQLLARARDEDAASDIGATYDKALEYCRSVRQYSVSPGNFAGGLTTIEEKSMGAVVKSGTRPIEGVLKVSMPVPHPGLWLLDSTPDPHFMQFGITNPNDSEGLIDLISCGAHILLFITGRGSVVGSPVAPTIKITGNSQTFERMREDMDFDASMVLTGRQTQAQARDSLLELVAGTAAGQLTRSEALGHKEYCIPYKYQVPTVSFAPACS